MLLATTGTFAGSSKPSEKCQAIHKGYVPSDVSASVKAMWVSVMQQF